MTQQNFKLSAAAVERTDLVDLCDVKFDDSFVRCLPGVPVTTNVPRAVRGASYTRVAPTAVRAPRLLTVLFSIPLAVPGFVSAYAIYAAELTFAPRLGFVCQHRQRGPE